MCTITWKMENSSYEIFFNRDELRKRAEAIAPKIYKKNNISSIYPLDPEGMGSWIFINNLGISGALLNYNIQLAQSEFKSRGTLITEISHYKSIQSMVEIIKKKNLREFRGFTLCLFEIDLNPLIFRWDGNDLKQIPPVQPIMSSAVKIDDVKKSRELLYKNMIEQMGDKRETHLAFHQSHDPEKSFLSTCMHRPDAKTVSFSHIYCDRNGIKFSYMGHSPCTKSDTVDISINLTQ